MVIGDPSVGKTSLIRRFVENQFSEDYISTIGVEFLKKEVWVGDKKVNFILWDTAGQTKWAQFKKSYYKGAVFIIIVFDVTNVKSYYSINHWLKEAQNILGEDIDFAIFANKIDLLEGFAVPNFDDYRNLKNLFEFIETSAKTGQNVEEIFYRIAEYLLRKIGNVEI